VIETTNPDEVRATFDGIAPVAEIGTATDDGSLSITTDETTLAYTAETIAQFRETLVDGLE
jgi:phosphoribosylformylglycinamidine synthase